MARDEGGGHCANPERRSARHGDPHAVRSDDGSAGFERTLRDTRRDSSAFASGLVAEARDNERADAKRQRLIERCLDPPMSDEQKRQLRG